MNIAVVDDEEAIREQISGFIKKRNPDFNISGFATGEGLLAAGKDFDIIFLDIQMEGMGGIEAARTLRQSGVDAVVIFITGIREYVFEAFDVSAFHYLLKPIEEQKFMEVLDRAAKEAGKRKGQKERQIFIRAKNQGYTLKLHIQAEKLRADDGGREGRTFRLNRHEGGIKVRKEHGGHPPADAALEADGH